MFLTSSRKGFHVSGESPDDYLTVTFGTIERLISADLVDTESLAYVAEDVANERTNRRPERRARVRVLAAAR